MIIYRDEDGRFASYESYVNDTEGKYSAQDVSYSWEDDRQTEREGELDELSTDEPDYPEGEDLDYESYDYDIGESEY